MTGGCFGFSQRRKAEERRKVRQVKREKALEDAVHAKDVEIEEPARALTRDTLKAYESKLAAEKHERYRQQMLENLRLAERRKKQQILEYLVQKRADLRERRLLDFKEFGELAAKHSAEARGRMEARDKAKAEARAAALAERQQGEAS